jgi:hypothetical protein
LKEVTFLSPREPFLSLERRDSSQLMRMLSDMQVSDSLLAERAEILPMRSIFLVIGIHSPFH